MWKCMQCTVIYKIVGFSSLLYEQLYLSSCISEGTALSVASLPHIPFSDIDFPVFLTVANAAFLTY